MKPFAFALLLMAQSWLGGNVLMGASPTAANRPQFLVPGCEREMRLLGQLFALHAQAKTPCTLWDPWLPMSTVWAATGNPPTAKPARDFYRHVFLTRRIDSEGHGWHEPRLHPPEHRRSNAGFVSAAVLKEMHAMPPCFRSLS